MLNHSERIVELGAVADRTPNRKIVGALRRGRRGGFDEGKVQTPFLGGYKLGPKTLWLVNGHHHLAQLNVCVLCW
jgi:hypothetical protein